MPNSLPDQPKNGACSRGNLAEIFRRSFHYRDPDLNYIASGSLGVASSGLVCSIRKPAASISLAIMSSGVWSWFVSISS